MRAVLAALLLAAVPTVAAAQPHPKIGPAIELATSRNSGSESQHAGAGMRVSAGVQRGRVSVMGTLELLSLTPEDTDLDSYHLLGTGKGISLRAELLSPKRAYLQAEVGLMWRTYTGDNEVRRGCSVFGTCDAGYFMETPRYHDVAPYVAVNFGARSHPTHWIGGGLQAGLTLVTLDRAGSAPDSHGAMVWIGFDGAIGTY